MDATAHLKIATCAWSYEDWRGVFYPEHLPATERLPFFARHLPAVEVDSTFFHTPTPAVTAHWAECTPPDFAFSCKLPRKITHERRLRDSADALHEFVAALRPLGGKLWCVVIQLPPSFQPARDESALRAFLHTLPTTVRFAVEFRHADWHVPRIAHLLEEHRVAWVWTDDTPLDHQAEGAFEFLPDTADFVYVRLMGDLQKKYTAEGRTIHHYRELMWPRDSALESWATRLRQAAETHTRVFVAASNHFEGFAPHTAQRLGKSLGFSFPMPKLDPPEDSAPDPQLELL